MTAQRKTTHTNGKQKNKAKVLGRYIVANPKTCHGKPTFRGTRILVSDVLEMVAEGQAWETIVEEWHGHISKKAIAEAVNLASQAFIRHAGEFDLKPLAA
jgi:uncharacterized protein (DUF433 family)